jgi:hypothetical protein
MTPFVVLRGGKGNRHCGHRSRGTYALTRLTPPKQRTVLFGKCGVRPSSYRRRKPYSAYAPLRTTAPPCHSDTLFLVILSEVEGSHRFSCHPERSKARCAFGTPKDPMGLLTPFVGSFGSAYATLRMTKRGTSFSGL